MNERKQKNILIQGNLKEKKVYYRFLPNEFSQGIWFLRIQSLAYSINDRNPIKDICTITSNLVTSQTYNTTDGPIINTCEQPLALLMFEPKVKRKVVSFDKNWSYINLYADELILNVFSIDEKKQINVDCDVNFIVQLEKRG